MSLLFIVFDRNINFPSVVFRVEKKNQENSYLYDAQFMLMSIDKSFLLVVMIICCIIKDYLSSETLLFFFFFLKNCKSLKHIAYF